MNCRYEKYIFLIIFFGILSFSQAQINKHGSATPDTLKKIYIASEPDYPPFCIVDQNGKADGFSVDLFKAAAKAVDIEVDIKIGIWNQIKQDLAEGKIDALPLVGRTPIRESLYDFTLPYLTLHGAIFINEGRGGIKSLADLKDKAIAVMKGDNAEEYVRRNNISNHIYTTPTFEEAFRELAKGEYDAVITQRVMGLELLKRLNIESIEPLDINLDEFRQDFCFAVKKGNNELLSRLNEGLSIIIADESFDKIRLKWFGPTENKKISVKDILIISLYIFIPLVIIFSTLSILFLRSEVKKKTSKLKESEEQFRAIFEQAAVGVALLNTRTGQYININQKYCDLLGYTKQEMLQKTFMDVTYPEDIQINIDKNAQLIEGKFVVAAYEKRYIRKDGSILWGNLTTSPLLTAGDKTQTYFHIAIVEDITERKKEELIIQQQNEQLKELNSTKDKFFSIIAHDLRSPLHGFLGLTELMSTDIDNISTLEISTLAKEMNQSALNIFKLLQNLLNWARIQDGTIEFVPIYCNLKEMVNRIIETINPLAAKKGIIFLNRLPENQKVFADENMINTTLRNLLSNAIKFTNKGGQITINANLKENRLVEISVSDNGIGIPDDSVDKLFKIGEKVGSIGTDGEPSTGLGLILCKEFVEKNGGSIWVESEKGKGSTFFFTVPTGND